MSSQHSIEQRARQSGLTVAITSPVISAVQTIHQQVEAAGHTQSSRMQALAAANVAFNARQAANAVQAGQAKAGGHAADQAGGIGISISLGASRSQSHQSSSADSARGSTVQAAGDVNIRASGAGDNSDLTLQGSTLQAGGTTRLQAEDDIRLLAATNTQAERNSQSSRSASIGMTAQLGAGGAQLGATASASRGTGQGAGSGTTYTHTQVSGQRVDIDSGSDTTLQGAVVQGEQVTANVGGSLTIQTQQDRSQYNERSRSAGASVTLGPASGGSLNLGQTRITSDYQSATEQSGIRAGDGGFQVKVEGDTTLVGAAITSTQAAVDNNQNSFQTGGTLTTTDLHNSASYSAHSAAVGIGVGGAAGNGTLAPSGVGLGRDSGSVSSTTLAAISGLAGNTEARTGDAGTGIGPIFNQDEVKREVNAQVLITQEFGRQASRAVGDYAGAQYANARAAGDTEGMAAWAEGGKHRVALHMLVGGLTGGVQGAVGAGVASAAAPQIEQLQEQLTAALQDAGLGDSAARTIASLASGATAATIGGAAGGTAGAASAFNADMNNRQLHPSERQLAQRLAEQLAREGITGPDGRPYSAEDIEAQMRLMGVAAQTKPNTMEVLTTPEAIAQALVNDPNLPLVFQGPAALEQLGQPNWALQQHIISLSRPHPEVPSIYLPSVSAPSPSSAPSGSAISPTARCANGDLACITGVGQQQNAPISAESVANTAAQLSRQSGVVAAGATAATTQAPLHVRPITGAVAVGATVVGIGADVVEQMARPDVKQAIREQLILGAPAYLLTQRYPQLAPLINEVVQELK